MRATEQARLIRCCLGDVAYSVPGTFCDQKEQMSAYINKCISRQPRKRGDSALRKRRAVM